MKQVTITKQDLNAGVYEKALMHLYCCDAETAKKHAARYISVVDGLEDTFGAHEEVALFSAPGRTEIGGNHTDHQLGRVLAGSVNIDMIAAVAFNGTNKMRVQSEGYDMCEIDLGELAYDPAEDGTSVALVRGSCKAFADRGAALSGLDVYVASNVPKGSGVSSSAAYETLLGTILNRLFMGGEGKPAQVTNVEIAQIGQWVENVYFNKPCGLLDQMAASLGNIITIDFADRNHPVVQPVDVDFAKAGLALCILDSGADHADLTDEYAAVPNECKGVAKICGAEVLREVPKAEFIKKIPECRAALGDRAVLRAFHFYADNDRVPQQVAALQTGDFDTFLKLINESGQSSWEYLQNVIPAGYKEHQDVAVAIAVAKEALGGEGAVRVHGGGFAGTIQAFVPVGKLDQFKAMTEAVLGEGKCHVLSIRPEGGVEL